MAHEFVLAMYRCTKDFPVEERYGLVSQLRRASRSIPGNFCEGCGRASDTEFARFVDIATGSAAEVEYDLLLAHELGYLSDDTYRELTETLVDVKLKLRRLYRALKKK
jgi:four helix bundle protein